MNLVTKGKLYVLDSGMEAMCSWAKVKLLYLVNGTSSAIVEVSNSFLLAAGGVDDLSRICRHLFSCFEAW